MPQEEKKLEQDIKVVCLTLAFSASLVIIFSILLFWITKPQGSIFILLVVALFVVNLLPVGFLYLFIKKWREHETNLKEQNTQKIHSLIMEKSLVESILQSIPEGLIITNLNGEITLINLKAVQILNMENMGVVSEPLSKVLPIDDQKGKKIENFQITFSNRINKKITLKINTFPLINQTQIQGTIYLISDISELREFENLKIDFVAEAAKIDF